MRERVPSFLRTTPPPLPRPDLRPTTGPRLKRVESVPTRPLERTTPVEDARRLVAHTLTLAQQRPLSQREWRLAWNQIVMAEDAGPQQSSDVRELKAQLAPVHPDLLHAQQALEDVRMHRGDSKLEDIQLEALKEALDDLAAEVAHLERGGRSFPQMDAYLRRLQVRMREEYQVVDERNRHQFIAPNQMEAFAYKLSAPRRQQSAEQTMAKRLLEETRKHALLVRSQLVGRLGLSSQEMASVFMQMAKGEYVSHVSFGQRVGDAFRGIGRRLIGKPAVPSIASLADLYHRLAQQEEEYRLVSIGQKEAVAQVKEEEWKI